MAINSLRGVSFGAGSLLSGYLRQARAELGATTPSGNLEPAQVTANQLKARILGLGDRIRSFEQLSGSFGRGSFSGTIGNSSGGGILQPGGQAPETPGVSAPSGPETVSFEVAGGGNRSRKFANEISKAFRKGGDSGDDRVLKGKNLSGEINFKIGEGENQRSFSVQVDSSTTFNDIVNSFNSQAGGRAQASLQEVAGGSNGSRFRIGIQTTGQSNPPPPIVEEEDPADEGESEDIRFDFLDGPDSVLDTESLAKDLRGFTSDFNRLSKFSRQGESGENVLAATAVDESAVQEVRRAIESATSEDGSVKLDQILRQDANGELRFDENRLQQLAEENPDGLVEALRSFAAEIRGREGVVNRYTGRQNLVDQAITNVETRVAQGAQTSGSRAEQISRFDEAASAVQTARIRTVA